MTGTTGSRRSGWFQQVLDILPFGRSVVQKRIGLVQATGDSFERLKIALV